MTFSCACSALQTCLHLSLASADPLPHFYRFADRNGRKTIALLASVGAVLGHSLTAMTGTFAVVMLSRFLLGVVRHGTTTYQVGIRHSRHVAHSPPRL
jgi:MFS family permease